jgi:hypothetical protein
MNKEFFLLERLGEGTEMERGEALFLCIISVLFVVITSKQI